MIRFDFIDYLMLARLPRMIISDTSSTRANNESDIIRLVFNVKLAVGLDITH